MLLFPNCKINIGLDILSKRSDGYHEIESVMFPVNGLCDGLELIESQNSGIDISYSGIPIDCDTKNNLVARAYEAVRSRYSIGGVVAHIHKVIPFGAGLGGGSSDASFAIKGLNNMFDLGMSMAEMEAIASTIGSDTPFFIDNTPKLCTGRGELMSTIEVNVSGKYLLIVIPEIYVSTAEAYGGIKPCKPQIPLSERIKLPMNQWKGSVVNAFEVSVFDRYPILADIKESLYNSGAIYASMSGSGSAIYGLFDTKTDFKNSFDVKCRAFGFYV